MTAKVLGMLDVVLNVIFAAFKKVALIAFIAALTIVLFLLSLTFLGYSIVT